jgi:glycerol-3-phosphate acyltransferase PlsY
VTTVIVVLCVLGSYLLGAIPFGYLGVRVFMGVDIREHGSGNIGTTNVVRVAGWWLAIPIFLLDVAKGLVPVLAARWLGGTLLTPGPGVSLLEVVCAFVAIGGHMVSIFLRGQGGKGVATGLGGLLALSWQSALLGLAAWLLALLLVRMVSAASCTAAVVVCVSAWLLAAEPLGDELPRCAFISLMAGLVIWKHRANFGRIRRGQEPRVLQGRGAGT